MASRLLISILIVLRSTLFSSAETAYHYLKPHITGDWWPVSGNPDLGAYTNDRQQPVDFAIWQAADGTWQIWSCIRQTKCGGNTRLFYRWEGKQLTDSNWKAVGIAMEADAALGETNGGLQAPHVFREMRFTTWSMVTGSESVWRPARMANLSPAC